MSFKFYRFGYFLYSQTFSHKIQSLMVILSHSSLWFNMRKISTVCFCLPELFVSEFVRTLFKQFYIVFLFNLILLSSFSSRGSKMFVLLLIYLLVKFGNLCTSDLYSHPHPHPWHLDKLLWGLPGRPIPVKFQDGKVAENCGGLHA